MIVVVGVAITGYSQTTPAQNADLAVPTFEAQNFDFGKIKLNEPVTNSFEFVNTGSEPLVITSVKASCGCTVTEYSKDPIAPGAKGVIGVKYATDRVGAFTKTVTVTSNAEGLPTKVLTIKGTVLPDPATATKS